MLLILSVLLIGFPLYYGFVISTQSMDEVIQKPQKLLPSIHLLENYAKIWNRIHMGRLLINSAIVAIAVSLGKIIISIISAFAIVYFDFRGKADRLLDDLHHPHAPRPRSNHLHL